MRLTGRHFLNKHTGMMCQPVGALVVGALAGLLSVLGYKYITVISSFLFILRYKCAVIASRVFSVQKGKK